MPSGKAAKARSSGGKPAARKHAAVSGPSKALRDRLAIELRVFERRPLAEIAALDGRSERQLERVVAGYEAHVAEHGEPPSELDMDPLAILRASLHRYGFQREMLYHAAAHAATSAELVGAVKALAAIEEKQTDVLVAVGLLPRELRALGHLLEMQSAAHELDRLLDGLEDGSLTPPQVRGRMAEWAGVTPVIEGTALTAA
jgi:hypothetical protein